MATMKDIVEGVTILMKYDPNGSIEAQHDQIFACNVTLEMVSEEDAATLDKLRWFWCEEYDCWSKFT
jgi:hypothetical protein